MQFVQLTLLNIFLPRSVRRKHILSQDPWCATMIDLMLFLAFPPPNLHTPQYTILGMAKGEIFVRAHI